MAQVRLQHIFKVYEDGTTAVKDLSLEIADGEFMVLVGPSGCGKTTALRMVAGLEDISGGDLMIGDKRVNDMASKDRDIAMVFQNYALYPHLTVADNMGFGLKLRKTPKAEINERVNKAAGILGLQELLKRKPRQLSGGQRQRVAMGRAIVREPQAFLMDEPLSNLDAKLRVQTHAEIARLQQELNVTTLYVTHDQTEAMTMGDRVAVMRKGVLQQVDAPQSLYDFPVNMFVAGFIGSPAMNLIEARLEPAGDGLEVVFGTHRVRMDSDYVARNQSLLAQVGKPIVLGIRPEDIEDAAIESGAPADRTVEADITLVEQMGSEAYLHFRIDAAAADTEEVREAGAEGVDRNAADASTTGRGQFIARVSPRTAVTKGSSAKLVFDTTRAHFFDPTTGLTLLQHQ